MSGQQTESREFKQKAIRDFVMWIFANLSRMKKAKLDKVDKRKIVTEIEHFKQLWAPAFNYEIPKDESSYREHRKDLCEECGKPGILVHHINKDRNNNILENLQTLCGKCHYKKHHISHTKLPKVAKTQNDVRERKQNKGVVSVGCCPSEDENTENGKGNDL